jgi:hypothetical protein
MHEDPIARNPPALPPVKPPPADAPPSPGRRRVQLRHEAAVVRAEIERMRRASWSVPDARTAY